MICNRMSLCLVRHQLCDQHRLINGIRMEDAVICAEVAIGHHQECQLPLWMLSMDTRKAFNTIDPLTLTQAN